MNQLQLKSFEHKVWRQACEKADTELVLFLGAAKKLPNETPEKFAARVKAEIDIIMAEYTHSKRLYDECTEFLTTPACIQLAKPD